MTEIFPSANQPGSASRVPSNSKRDPERREANALGGGTVNFPNESGKQFKFTTLGAATGDLARGIGVLHFQLHAGR
jgi:hypothetical protein